MVIYSIDIETTGLNPDKCQILSIGMVREDTQNPESFEKTQKLQLGIVADEYRGEEYGLNMNKVLIQTLRDKSDGSIIYVDRNAAVTAMVSFMRANGDTGVNIAGKNFAMFDLRFLERLPGWKRFNYHRRIIDPSVLYLDALDDDSLPGLSECKKRAGLGTDVTHNAVEDAWDVVELLRKKLGYV